MSRNIKTLIWLILAVSIVGLFFYFNKESAGNKVTTDIVKSVDGNATFNSSEFDFTFEYPKNFATSSEDFDGGVKKIIVESNEFKKGFQITTAPFDESEPLTEARIKKDLPDLVMDNVKNIEIDGFGALSFNSIDDSVGKTFEVWFNAGGKLYEIQTYEEFESSLMDILKTWKIK